MRNLLGYFAVGLVIGIMVIASASAEEYELGSRWPDVVPGDGVLDAGTSMNPWEVSADGETVAELRTRWPDVTEDDGVLDAGSALNPWVVETRD